MYLRTGPSPDLPLRHCHRFYSPKDGYLLAHVYRVLFFGFISYLNKKIIGWSVLVGRGPYCFMAGGCNRFNSDPHAVFRCSLFAVWDPVITQRLDDCSLAFPFGTSSA